MTEIPPAGDPVSIQMASIMAENERLRDLLNVERAAHRETRRKLEKADHDRKRYAKRIRFLQGQHIGLFETRHSRQLCDNTRKEAVG